MKKLFAMIMLCFIALLVLPASVSADNVDHQKNGVIFQNEECAVELMSVDVILHPDTFSLSELRTECTYLFSNVRIEKETIKGYQFKICGTERICSVDSILYTIAISDHNNSTNLIRADG